VNAATLHIVTLHIATLHLAPDRALHDLALTAAFPDAATPPPPLGEGQGVRVPPSGIHATAREGAANAIRLDIVPISFLARQRPIVSSEATGSTNRESKIENSITLAIDDTCSLLSALTAAVRQIPNPSPDLASAISTLTDIHTSFSGGSLLFTGTLAPPPASVPDALPVLDGALTLNNATMRTPPRALQLLALKTKKQLQRAPLLEKTTIRRLRFAPPELTMENLAFAGAGLLNLKLDTATYNFTTDALKSGGVYYGIPFEIIGTSAAPQIYLKENPVTKLLGEKSDLNWGD